ncbi:hypothetical protein JCM10296v2_002234 [Rhodotorula toruloides]
MAHRGRHSPAYGHTLASSAPVWSFTDFTAYTDDRLQPVRYELDRRADSQPSQAAVISRRLRDLTNWQTALCGARGGRTWEAVMEESGIVPYHLQVNLDDIVQVLQALPLEVEAAPMLPYISRYLSSTSPPTAPIPSAFQPVGRATLGSHQQHQASSTPFIGQLPSDADTWIKTIHDGIDERITQRFVNAHAFLENLTGWPLRETFVLWMIVSTGHVNAFYRQLQQIIKPLLNKLVSDKTAAEVTKDRNWFRLVHTRLHMVTRWLVYIHSNGSRATLLKLSGSELDRLTAEISRIAQGLLHAPAWEDAEPLPTLQQLFAHLQLHTSVAP